VYVRTKARGGRRYLYLVEGRREGGAVRQRTVCYLGSLPKLAAGVPQAVRAKARGLDVDWGRVNADIARIPLTFNELAEFRRLQFATSTRSRRGHPSQGTLPRAEGELEALSRLSENRFRQLFEQTGPLSYRRR
jgi:hypothetical protein